MHMDNKLGIHNSYACNYSIFEHMHEPQWSS